MLWYLLPFTVFWRLGWAWHRWWLRRQGCPEWKAEVWGVGSLRIGGGGRTSTVLALSRALTAQGQRHVILCADWRYRRPLARVWPEDTAQSHTDEAVLLARKCEMPVYVAYDRSTVVDRLVELHGVSLVLLDDGLEDPRLQRAKWLRVLKPGEPEFPKPWALFPCGPFRSLAQDHPQVRRQIQLESPEARRSLQKLCWPSTGAELPKGSSVLLACAVGDPADVMCSLREAGYMVEGHRFWRDHSDRFAHEIAEFVQGSALPVVITEKDEVRLTSLPEGVVVARQCYELDFDKLHRELRKDVVCAD